MHRALSERGNLIGILVLRCMVDTVFLLEVGDNQSPHDLQRLPSCDTSTHKPDKGGEMGVAF